MKIFSVLNKKNSNIDYILVGLGNPGIKYENTRHNSGFMALDYIANKFSVKINKNKFNSLYNFINIDNKKIMLLKPQTFMNLSGNAVFEAMSYYKLNPKNVVIIFDDVSFDVGVIKIKPNGSHGGQNGMRSIIETCGTSNFPRIKIGIGSALKPAWNLSDWVLSKFTESETNSLNLVFENVKNAVELIVSNQIDVAMNKYN